jgi:hypothetical protein
MTGTTCPPCIRHHWLRRRVLLVALLLTLLFAASRCLGMLGPPALRPLLPASFVLMALAPWLFLSQAGRRHIGLRAPPSWLVLAPSLLAGVGAALACFAFGMLLYGGGPDNWFVTVAASYRRMMNTSGLPLLSLHLVFTLPALLFSPIGEEIFFRGMLQRAFEQRLSIRASTMIECAAFGLIHLCHHGMAWSAAGLAIRPVSGMLWVLAMFLTALLFAKIRQRTGSLFPAMAAHAAFNATMNTVIFAFLSR